MRLKYSPTMCMLFGWSEARDPKSLEHFASAPLGLSDPHINQKHFSAIPKYPGGQCPFSKKISFKY